MGPCQLLLAASKLLSTVNDEKTTRHVSGKNGLLSENRKPFIENFDTQEQTHHHRNHPKPSFTKFGIHSITNEEIKMEMPKMTPIERSIWVRGVKEID